LAFMLKNHREHLIQWRQRIHEKNLRLHHGEVVIESSQETD
jgi:hypothetical protein